MDHSQRCDVSNIPGTDFKLENKKLKDEIESLKTQHRIEKLEMENQSLKWENQVLSSTQDESKIIVLENEKLKGEIKSLKVENAKLKNNSGKFKEIENQKLKADSEKLKEKVEKLEDNVESLRIECEKMKENSVKSKGNVEKLEDNVESLRIENEKLKEDSRKLKDQVEKLKESVGGLKIERENVTENLKQLNENSGDMGENIKQLEKEIEQKVAEESIESEERMGDTESLNIENKNKKVESQPSIQQPIEKQLFEGVSRFIEGIEPKTKIYDSYVQWYDDVLEKMRSGIVYKSHEKNQKYLFISNKYFNFKSHSVSFVSKHRNKHVNASFFANTFEEGFTHKNTKLVCVLHPKQPLQFVELDQKEIVKDKAGKLIGHFWEVDFNNIKKGGCYVNQKKTCSMILLCIKK